ncbi:MAG: FAD-dependent oxidoreductase, partial [Gemmataceae bacterium]|nr:FAD-dependent oxidoreductase [Gemmataceae bacterium]
MARLLVVGGGYFGSLAAAWARYRGLEALVFDAGLPGAASPAAAGLFQEAWIRPAFRPYLLAAMSLLDRLYGLNSVQLTLPDGRHERFHFVPPRLILEHKPLRQRVTAVGDGWIEADGC